MNLTKLAKLITAFSFGVVLSWLVVQLFSSLEHDSSSPPYNGQRPDTTMNDANSPTQTEIHVDLTNPVIQEIVSRHRKAFQSRNASEVYLAVLVKSFPKGRVARDTLRTTWFIRDTKTHRPVPSRLTRQYFLIGEADTEETEKQLEQEQKEFEDLIRVPFPEEYAFLAPKVFYGLQFIGSRLSFNYALVADQDTLVNWQTFLPWLASSSRQGLYAGRSVDNRLVQRDEPAKFHVPSEIYKPDMYPPMAAGFGYVLSSDVVFKIFSLLQEQQLVGEDDAMVGVMATLLGIKVTSVSDFQMLSGCTAKYPMVLGGIGSAAKMKELHNNGIQRTGVC